MITSFMELQPGDTVTRMLGGVVPMAMVVTQVDEHLIWCSVVEPRPGWADDLQWTFSRRNGAEIDDELGWDESQTGSYLVLNND